jgi:hypothetical protein
MAAAGRMSASMECEGFKVTVAWRLWSRRKEGRSLPLLGRPYPVFTALAHGEFFMRVPAAPGTLAGRTRGF